ncbi:GTP-binding protein LepA [Leptotrichia sp. oral taxon 879]|uniref:GTP-binding protein LepA n=1 Tax=Leptotrichia sp. oral taxon 879 TaxID=1227267 RepID=UPI001E3CA382|nr:GTP-binding protein LepA [Leptotrichia sp. oral taxon 879]
MMKYKTLKPLIYSGVSYEAGAEVDILEKSVVKSCLERELIEEIKDTTEKVVSENLIEENNQDVEKTDKENKKNKNK